MKCQFIVGGAVLLGGFLAYLKRNGIFSKIVVERKKMGPYVVIYDNYQGAYKTVGKEYSRVENDAKEYEVGGWGPKKAGLAIGFYFDDPAKTAGKDCRTSVGVIANDATGATPEELAKSKKEWEEHELCKEKGYKVGIFPEGECFVVKYPFRGLLSIITGIARAYPALKKAMDDENETESSMEVYDSTNKCMYITFPTEKRTDLLVFDRKKEG